MKKWGEDAVLGRWTHGTGSEGGRSAVFFAGILRVGRCECARR